MFMQRFTGTKVRSIIMRNGTKYNIDPPKDDYPFWMISWHDKAAKTYNAKQFRFRLDEQGSDLGRKEAQEFLQERRLMR
jgi:hypothetical protein